MSPFHYAFDKLYPIIRFTYERVQGHAWFTEIEPNVWLGGAPTYPRDYQFLLDNNIQAVINIRAERKDDIAFYQKHSIDSIQIKVYDALVPDSDQITEGVNFITKNIDNGKATLVHCAKGRGRSAVLLAAYFMKAHNISFADAVKLMKDKRSLVKQEARHKKAAESWFETIS